MEAVRVVVVMVLYRWATTSALSSGVDDLLERGCRAIPHMKNASHSQRANTVTALSTAKRGVGATYTPFVAAACGDRGRWWNMLASFPILTAFVSMVCQAWVFSKPRS